MIETISEGKNHKAINIGALNQLSDYAFIHPKLRYTINNKLFIGEHLQLSGAEISFMELPAKTTISFLHKHQKHEEVYIFLKGYGQFQVDNQVFNIKEGSIVRVSPDGGRTLRNDADNGMIYMVIQSVAGTLSAYNVSDGCRAEGEIKITS